MTRPDEQHLRSFEQHFLRPMHPDESDEQIAARLEQYAQDLRRRLEQREDR